MKSSLYSFYSALTFKSLRWIVRGQEVYVLIESKHSLSHKYKPKHFINRRFHTFHVVVAVYFIVTMPLAITRIS